MANCAAAVPVLVCASVGVGVFVGAGEWRQSQTHTSVLFLQSVYATFASSVFVIKINNSNQNKRN